MFWFRSRFKNLHKVYKTGISFIEEKIDKAHAINLKLKIRLLKPNK